MKWIMANTLKTNLEKSEVVLISNKATQIQNSQSVLEVLDSL